MTSYRQAESDSSLARLQQVKVSQFPRRAIANGMFARRGFRSSEFKACPVETLYDAPNLKGLLVKRLWYLFAAVMMVSFSVLSWIGTRIYQ